jgi:hypothetical protein
VFVFVFVFVVVVVVVITITITITITMTIILFAPLHRVSAVLSPRRTICVVVAIWCLFRLGVERVRVGVGVCVCVCVCVCVREQAHYIP